ncbi:hypothetical protein D3C76_77500 [compost metagenome]
MSALKELTVKENIALQIYVARLSNPDSNKDPNVAVGMAFEYAEAFLKARNANRRADR